MSSDPTPGDPYRVRQLARSAEQMAEDAGLARSAVRSLASDGAVLSWVGLAGDVFRDALDDFPHQLGKLQDSYDEAADALTLWATRLDDLQDTADRALAQGKQAQLEIDAVQGQLLSAQLHVDSAAAAAHRLSSPTQGVPPPSPEQVRAATRDLVAAQQRVGHLNDDLAGARSRLAAAKRMAEQARELRHSTAKTVKHKLYDASKAGIANKSRWQKFKEAASKAWDITVKAATIAVAVLSVVAIVAGGPLVWGVLFALSAVLLADSLAKYARGEGSLFDVGLNMLGVIPGGRLLGAAGRLLGRSATGARALAGLTAGRQALTGMTRAVRAGLGRTALRVKPARSVEEFLRRSTDFSTSPSALARKFQTGKLYPHADDWVDRLATRGERFYVGEPGAGRFVVPEGEVAKAGGSARRYYEGVQVGPRDGLDGVPRYRDGGLQGYEIRRPFPLSDSVARANKQFGDGGFRQHYLPMDLDDLERLGYIAKTDHVPLGDVVSNIPASGRTVTTGAGP